MSDRPTLILGAGLAGISTAYHLKNQPNVVVERESSIGGTARSFKVGKFTFDITGHLLHLHTPYTKKLIPKLLGNKFFSCVRKAWIFSKKTYTKYPFQASTHGLPQNVVRDCVLGFVDAYMENKLNNTDRSNLDFRSWCYRTFGSGIAEHFMIPYNEKLYQTPSSKMTTDWCGAFVPMPKLAEVIRGALEPQNQAFGYNTTFLYPKEGGIQSLAIAMARNVRDIYLNTSVLKLDWKRKHATLSNGETIPYSSLVNSIPLLELLKLMGDLPPSIQKAKRSLRFASILCLNIGVDRSKISDASWVYFPEKIFPFYRVGFPMNFTPHVVPKGCSSMYVEVPMDLKKPFSKAKILRDVRQGLIESRILKHSDRFPVVQFIPVKYAYIIYDQHRQKALRTIFSFLKENDIQSIGRYGAWKYSFMEEAILDGKKAADSILNGHIRS